MAKTFPNPEMTGNPWLKLSNGVVIRAQEVKAISIRRGENGDPDEDEGEVIINSDMSGKGGHRLVVTSSPNTFVRLVANALSTAPNDSIIIARLGALGEVADLKIESLAEARHARAATAPQNS